MRGLSSTQLGTLQGNGRSEDLSYSLCRSLSSAHLLNSTLLLSGLSIPFPGPWISVRCLGCPTVSEPLGLSNPEQLLGSLFFFLINWFLVSWELLFHILCFLLLFIFSCWSQGNKPAPSYTIFPRSRSLPDNCVYVCAHDRDNNMRFTLLTKI